jgi:hypothetical protein
VARTWWHHWASNDLGSALKAAEQARALCARVVDPFSRHVAFLAHAYVIATIGPEDAMRRVSEERKRTRLGRQFEFWLMGAELTYEVARGVPVARLEDRVQALPQPTAPQDRALVSYLFAHSHLVAGEYGAAERRALEIVAEPVPAYQWFARACLALAALHRGDVEAALAHTDTAMQISVGNGLLHRSLLLLARAEALRAAGHEREAMEAIDDARSFVLASVSGLPQAARDDCLKRIWANVRVLTTAQEWLGMGSNQAKLM